MLAADLFKVESVLQFFFAFGNISRSTLGEQFVLLVWLDGPWICSFSHADI